MPGFLLDTLVLRTIVDDFAGTGIRRLREATSRLAYLLDAETHTTAELAARAPLPLRAARAIDERSLAVEPTLSFERKR